MRTVRDAFPVCSTAKSKRGQGLHGERQPGSKPGVASCVISGPENEVIHPRLAFLISETGTIVDTRQVVEWSETMNMEHVWQTECVDKPQPSQPHDDAPCPVRARASCRSENQSLASASKSHIRSLFASSTLSAALIYRGLVTPHVFGNATSGTHNLTCTPRTSHQTSLPSIGPPEGDESPAQISNSIGFHISIFLS